MIEETEDRRAVIFVPSAPSKTGGQIYVVSTDLIKRLPKTFLKNLDDSVKSFGREILNFK